MRKFKCKVCKAVFEVPVGAEPVCPVCHVTQEKLEEIVEIPANKYAGTQTEKNLEAAFAGESQARNKYTYFASVAKKEGYEQISALFLKTAENEKEHAKLWFKEQRLRGRRRTQKSYSTFKVRRGGREEVPLIQGKRNPSKTVGVARGHQRADTLKP